MLCLCVCICWLANILSCRSKYVVVKTEEEKKKTCVFPLQHIPMTLRARDPCESICSTYINTIQSTWLVCTCCWLLLSLSDYYTIYFTLNWTASIQLVLNTRSRVEQHIQASVYLYKRFPSHNAVHIMQTERFFASNAHSSCQIQ